jgi:hypothetical protein
MRTKIKVSLVDCDIPLLISSKILEDWEASQDYKEGTITIGRTKETFKLEKLPSGHFGLCLQLEPSDPFLKKCFFGLEEISNKEKTQQIRKVH